MTGPDSRQRAEEVWHELCVTGAVEYPHTRECITIIVAALAQARREGVEELRDWLKSKDIGAGVDALNAWLERETASLLSKGGTDG